MDTCGETSFATLGDLELEITRSFDATRQAVFDAFMVCEAARRWMGPPGWDVAACEIDLRPGRHLPVRLEESPRVRGRQRRHVQRGLVAGAIGHDSGCRRGRTRHTVVLTEEGGETTMTYVVEYPTGEMRDAAAAMPMKETMDIGYDKLADYLARSTP